LGRGLIVTTPIAASVAAIVTLAGIRHHGLLLPSFPERESKRRRFHRAFVKIGKWFRPGQILFRPRGGLAVNSEAPISRQVRMEETQLLG